VAEVAEQPEAVGGVPVVLVAIENDGHVVGDATLAGEFLETRLVDEIPVDLVLHLRVPVQFEGARDVSDLIQEDILVRFENADVGIIQVLRNPLCRDQYLRMGILRKRRLGIAHGLGRHETLLNG
jgi:hypothetical protein